MGSSDDPYHIVPCELALTSNTLGFLHGRDKEGNLIVKHAEEGLPLEKGDRILEVSGTMVSSLSDMDFTRLLRQSSGKLEMVVLRQASKQQLIEAQRELEGVKEDLSLAMMDLDSVQLENQEMNKEISR